MLLHEFFDRHIDNTVNVRDDVRNYLLDILTPLASSGVPFVSIEGLLQKLEGLDLGIFIDKDLIMDVLDPEEVKIIQKVDGEKVYFDVMVDNGEAKIAANKREKDKAHVEKMASDAASKALKK